MSDKKQLFLFLMGLVCISNLFSQKISGVVLDEETKEPLIGANITVENTSNGTVTDFDGNFNLKIESFPVNIVISYIGYATKNMTVPDDSPLSISLGNDGGMVLNTVEVTGQRISEKQKAAPLTVESLDLAAIKATPAANFYEGLGALKDVDLTTASLGFTIINTRGFNSTSPVRSLQTIDGVDNQSPGLNFSLGNFLGASELDIKKVDLIVGASSAFYGPNAFNGVISMETKNPFILKGLSAQVKVGERNLKEGALRWAQSFKNKNGLDWFAYKINGYILRADDWEATNYNPVFDSPVDAGNPGGFNAVNIYGDEFNRASVSTIGIGRYYRRGYREIDLVNYETKNDKASVALHFRLNPEKDLSSSELILSSNFGGGTTVYQGDNRFSLRDIKFFQHRLEFRKEEKFFVRAYATHEDAGKSYDPFFTALKLQQASTTNLEWNTAYLNYWSLNVEPEIRKLEGFPRISQFPGDPQGYRNAVNSFLGDYETEIQMWHKQARAAVDVGNVVAGTQDFLEPGTNRFEEKFKDITSRIANSEDGTRFFDKSALIHLHGEYKFDKVLKNNEFENLDFVLGANVRIYLPDSKGSILLDTGGVNINTYEYGIYGGSNYSFAQNKIRLSGTLRMDKHENFEYLFSPALSLVYKPSANNYLRVSFSSAIRNPTLTDQYLNYNVGPAILRGNINGVSDLVTVESFENFLNTQSRSILDSFDVSPIRPESVRTFELGYRTTVFNSLYLDFGSYFSRYENFIGYQIGIDANIPPPPNAPIPSSVQVYRVSSNAMDIVYTRGASLGFNYYFANYFSIKGNYSFNQLTTNSNDPIIPAFNTPKNKYNIGISGRGLDQFIGSKNILFGFNINYKWVEGFLFEGSPQFSGYVETYDLLDAQINFEFKKVNTVVKLGASNILDNKVYQTYGGPQIGRMAYVNLLYEFINLK